MFKFQEKLAPREKKEIIYDYQSGIKDDNKKMLISLIHSIDRGSSTVIQQKPTYLKKQMSK